MGGFATKQLPLSADIIAPDGSAVRILLGLGHGTMAHFTLEAGQVATAVAHRTVEEIWYVVAGQGEMWRKLGDQEEVVPLVPGCSLTIPLGTHFQFRAAAHDSVAAIGVTMPPWPGDDEAFVVPGPWEPTAPEGER